MATKLQEKQGVLDQKRAEMADIFAKYPDMNMPVEVAEDLKQRNDELTDLGKEVDQLKALEKMQRENAELIEQGKKSASGLEWQKGKGGKPNTEERKSLGQRFVESKAFTDYQKGSGQGPIAELDADEMFERKAVFDSSTGYAPQAVRTGVIIDFAAQGLTVADLIPQGVTSQNAIVYMEETTSTNAAAETAEKADAPESAIVYTEKTSSVREITTFLPVTEIALEDAPMIESVINNRLAMFVQMREDLQLIAGDGNAPNLRGMLNVVGIQTQAKGADPTPDAIYKAMTLVQTGAFLSPSGIIMHPNDWQDIRLMRTTDGVYIWGSPSDPGPERIWGLPVVKTTRMTENSCIVAAFDTAMQIFRRKAVSLQISNSHADFFVKRQLAIRATERLGFVVYRPKAICTVTGI
jgi:HK97 family phage major capsid protein